MNLKSFHLSVHPLMEKSDTYALRGICMIMVIPKLSAYIN